MVRRRTSWTTSWRGLRTDTSSKCGISYGQFSPTRIPRWMPSMDDKRLRRPPLRSAPIAKIARRQCRIGPGPPEILPIPLIIRFGGLRNDELLNGAAVAFEFLLVEASEFLILGQLGRGQVQLIHLAIQLP